MAEGVNEYCTNCQTDATFTKSDEGFYICNNCYSQADDIFDAAVDDETYVNTYGASQRTQLSQSQYDSQPMYQSQHQPNVFTESNEPRDFGGGLRKEFSTDVASSLIRDRYLNGLRVIIQLQCEALVEKFGVSPLIVGLIGTVWVRFLVCKGVVTDDWADKAVDEDDENEGEVDELKSRGRDRYIDRFRLEHFSVHKKRLVMIWFRSLAREIPVSSTLAVSFLVCHVAREGVLPTDLLRWALEGNIPYFSAFTQIEKHLGCSPDACPVSDSYMFRPVVLVSSQKLEAEAAKIAKKIGLDLPPVNFYAIASRFCRELSLPTTMEILPKACRISEWCAPPELYLSKNEARIPTRVYVMAVLIVAIRIIFDISGYGFWESSLSDDASSCSRGEENEDVKPQSQPAAGDQDSNLSAGELLQLLEAKYKKLDEEMFRTEIEGRQDCSLSNFDFNDFSSDLSSYIKYCEDVVFPECSFEENNLWTEFKEFYQKNKDCQMESSDHSVVNNKRSRNGSYGSSKDDKSTVRAASHSRGHYSNNSTDQDDDCSQDDQGCSTACSTRSPQVESSHKDRAIRQMKLEMEENKFSYISPRKNVKRKAYLHYARKKQDVFLYAVHADYYILLRACAKVAQVETRVMHTAVLGFERRLNWLEKKMDESLNLTEDLQSFCDHCRVEP